MRFLIICLILVSWILMTIQANTPVTVLQSSETLTGSCYNFPATSFDSTNCVKCKYGSSPHFVLDVGDAAIDFTLSTLEGDEVTLSSLLEEKAVVMLWGMHTCPAFQGLGTSYPFDQSSYEHEWDVVEEYSDDFTFLHLVGPEPHPSSPEVNFDSGRIKTNYWSTIPQGYDYETRRQHGQKIASLVHPNALLVLDDLGQSSSTTSSSSVTEVTTTKMNNPVWCSYSMGARTAMVVGKGGKIVYTRDWFRAENLIEQLETMKS